MMEQTVRPETGVHKIRKRGNRPKEYDIHNTAKILKIIRFVKKKKWQQVTVCDPIHVIYIL